MEGSDGPSELVAFLNVLDRQVERGAGVADERRGREGAPLVEGAAVGGVGGVALGNDDGSVQWSVGEGEATVVGERRHGRLARGHDEPVVVEGHDVVGDRRGGAGLGDAVDRGP